MVLSPKASSLRSGRGSVSSKRRSTPGLKSPSAASFTRRSGSSPGGAKALPHQPNHDDDATAAAGPLVRQAPADLPGPVRAVLQFMVFDTLLVDDELHTIIRKVFMLVPALFGVMMPAYGAVYVALHGTTAANTAFAVAVAIFLDFVPCYIYMRVTKQYPERAMLFAMGLTALGLCLGAVSAPHIPFGTYLGLWSIAMAIIDAPMIVLWYAGVAVPGLCVAAYNEALLLRPEGAEGYDGSPALIAGFDRPTVPERIAMHYGAVMIVVCMALVVKVVIKESVLQIGQAKKNAVLARLVSGQLAQYQTERARCFLSVAEKGASVIPEDVLYRISANEDDDDDADLRVDLHDDDDRQQQREGALEESVDSPWERIDPADLAASVEMIVGADAELIRVFGEIIDNLEQYRPHLPNWLIQAAMGADGDADGGNASSVSDKDTDGARSDDGGGLGGSQRFAGSTTSQSTPGASGLESMAGVRRSPGHRSSLSPSMEASGRVMCPPVSNVADEHVKHVAQARVFFKFDSAAPSAKLLRATNELVDRLHAAATATHAALHSFVGDTVEASWNAASRTHLPAAKAVRFLARLHGIQAAATEAMTSARDAPALRISAATMSGSARVLMAGDGITKSLTLSAAWSQTLDALASLARSHNAFVTDLGSANTALDVVTQSVALLRVAPSPTDETSTNISAPAHGKGADTQVDDSSPSAGDHGLLVLGEAKEASSSPAVGDGSITAVEVRGFQEEGDEWMYVLEEKEGRCESTVTAAFGLCTRGRFADANTSLSELPSSFLASSPLAARLVARTKLLAERPPPSVAEGFVDIYDPAPLSTLLRTQ